MKGFQFENVSVDIHKEKILDNVSFQLEPGTITALVGHNGAGKSTIMKTIMGIQEPKEGAITLNGKVQSTNFVEFKQQLTYIPEEPFLLSELTTMQHFQLYGESYQIGSTDLQTRIDYYVRELEIADKLDEYPESLSKGMRQKVQTICALLPDVSLLLVDEPFMGLDVYGSDFLEKVLLQKKQEGTAILLTSHQLDRIKGLAEQYVMLQQGRVVNSGTMADFDVLKRRFD